MGTSYGDEPGTVLMVIQSFVALTRRIVPMITSMVNDRRQDSSERRLTAIQPRNITRLAAQTNVCLQSDAVIM